MSIGSSRKCGSSFAVRLIIHQTASAAADERGRWAVMSQTAVAWLVSASEGWDRRATRPDGGRADGPASREQAGRA